MTAITSDQKKKIREYIPIYVAYCKSEQAEKGIQLRKERLELFGSLTNDRILKMEEPDIFALITQLWASQIWKNQKYLLDKIISSNGLEKLKDYLAELLCGQAPIPERYERFLKNIKHLGTASVTEMLASKYPDQCAIWNDKARKALTILGFKESLPLSKYHINGKELARFIEVCRNIAHELAAAGLPKPDLFEVDYYLYEVAQAPSAVVDQPISEERQFDHDEVCEHIRDIGIWLGFQSDTKQKVSHGAEVDVMWRSQIGNLGVVTYVFEVQKSGSIDSLILNLQKSRANPTVQKVVAVSDSQQLEKIRNEILGLPTEFRDALALLSVKDVETVFQNLSTAMKVIEELQLVKDLFPIQLAKKEK